MHNNNGPVFFVMGVSGCGKSTIGTLLASALGIPFFDGDDFHPAHNVKKMASGEALNDEDRKGWLLSLNQLAIKHAQEGAVIVCSALKAKYREALSRSIENKVSWVLLDGSFEEIRERLNKRKGHFMPGSLLKSQFNTLEKPKHAIIVSIKPAPERIVEQIMSQIATK